MAREWSVGFDQGRLIEITVRTDVVDGFLLKESKTSCNGKSAGTKITSTKTLLEWEAPRDSRIERALALGSKAVP
jgi:hypothetical protein